MFIYKNSISKLKRNFFELRFLTEFGNEKSGVVIFAASKTGCEWQWFYGSMVDCVG